MLNIILCSNDSVHLKKLEKLIFTTILIEDLDMKIILSTDDPCRVIDYLEKNNNNGIYFLDVKLNHNISGLQLGKKIRKKELNAKIIFITSHFELVHHTFDYKIEALDFIFKDYSSIMVKKVKLCLKIANDYYTSPNHIETDRIKLKINNKLEIFLLKDIIFFETSDTPHKLTLHLSDRTIEFYGRLKDIQGLCPNLIRIHKSFLVNLNRIKQICFKSNKITMDGNTLLFASARGLKELRQLYNKD